MFHLYLIFKKAKRCHPTVPILLQMDLFMVDDTVMAWQCLIFACYWLVIGARLRICFPLVFHLALVTPLCKMHLYLIFKKAKLCHPTVPILLQMDLFMVDDTVMAWQCLIFACYWLVIGARLRICFPLLFHVALVTPLCKMNHKEEMLQHVQYVHFSLRGHT